MLRLISALAFFVLLANTASAQVQFFPPQGPCTAENPILAWNGNGSTYCTHFPTAVLPDCGDGEYLTKKNGNLLCVKLSTGAVSSSTPASPTPTTPAPTPAPTTNTSSSNSTTAPKPAYNSNGTPTGAAPSVAATNGPITIPNPVVRTGNNACPDITIPVCASDSVLVNYGTDFNGCQTSPQCKYMGSTAAAQAVKASYANGGLSNNSVASSNGYGYYNPYSSYYGTPYYTTPTYVDEYYVEPAPTYYEPVYSEPAYSEPSYSEPSYAEEE